MYFTPCVSCYTNRPTIIIIIYCTSIWIKFNTRCTTTRLNNPCYCCWVFYCIYICSVIFLLVVYGFVSLLAGLFLLFVYAKGLVNLELIIHTQIYRRMKKTHRWTRWIGVLVWIRFNMRNCVYVFDIHDKNAILSTLNKNNDNT